MEQYSMISLYKGEGRILVIPYIHHVAGYSVFADWSAVVTDVEDHLEIGKAIRSAIDFIKSSLECTDMPGETDYLKPIKENSKYTTEISFWENNLLTRIKILEDNSYYLCSMRYSDTNKRGYSELVKEIRLPAAASDEEIGAAVVCAFKEAEKS